MDELRIWRQHLSIKKMKLVSSTDIYCNTMRYSPAKCTQDCDCPSVIDWNNLNQTPLEFTTNPYLQATTLVGKCLLDRVDTNGNFWQFTSTECLQTQNEGYQENNTAPAVTHGGRSVMSGAVILCLAQCVLNLCRIQWNLKASTACPRMCSALSGKLGFSCRSMVLQQDNDPEHATKNRQEWLRTKHCTILRS